MPDTDNSHRSESLLNRVDLPFLLFIIGVVNVKTYVKLGAIAIYFIYLLLSKKWVGAKLTGPALFYILLPIVGCIGGILNKSFSVEGYAVGTLFCIMQWFICLATFLLLTASVKVLERKRLEYTVQLFFILNLVVSAAQLIGIMIESHTIMPYWLNDSAQQYGVSTGDHLYGILFTNSVANSAMCILAGVYFIYKNKRVLSFFCFLVMLLCTSNLSVLISLVVLALMAVFGKRPITLAVVRVAVPIIILYPLLSPVNVAYMKTLGQTYISHNKEVKPEIASTRTPPVVPPTLSAETHEAEALPFSYKLALNDKDEVGYVARLKELKYRGDSGGSQHGNVVIEQAEIDRAFQKIYGVPVVATPLHGFTKPGKIYSMLQTADYMSSSATALLFGAGNGNFSSKLALRMTGLQLQGKYPAKYVYASPSFMQYHLYTTLYYLSQDVALHSVLNMPYSVYNQIGGEYGLVGICLFVFLYLVYFWRHARSGYGIFLILVALMILGVDYWFEMATFTVVFELLMIMNIFAQNRTDAAPPDNSINVGI